MVVPESLDVAIPPQFNREVRDFRSWDPDINGERPQQIAPANGAIKFSSSISRKPRLGEEAQAW
jgi:hypothetical protein